MLAAADAGQTVVASILGLGAAGVAGAVIAMAWNLRLHHLQVTGRLARRAASEAAEPADGGVPAAAMSGNGGLKVSEAVIEGPDSVVIGEQARYRVRRSGTERVVSWAAGGGAVTQVSDPAHPDDLLLVADRPGTITVFVRLRDGLAERRETKAVTAVADPDAAMHAIASRLLLHDWPVITVAILVAGFAAALVAVGSLVAGDFIALAASLTAVLAVVAAGRH